METCCHSDSSGKQLANTGGRKSQIIVIKYDQSNVKDKRNTWRRNETKEVTKSNGFIQVFKTCSFIYQKWILVCKHFQSSFAKSFVEVELKFFFFLFYSIYRYIYIGCPKNENTFTFKLFLMCINFWGHPIYIYIYMVYGIYAPPWGLSILAKELSAAAKVFERIEHSGSR